MADLAAEEEAEAADEETGHEEATGDTWTAGDDISGQLVQTASISTISNSHQQQTLYLLLLCMIYGEY